MKFEKLNENKIRITLNMQDLAEKHIDFHSFMSNSKESQNLFLDMLDEAEKKVGFVTKDYKIRIEALAMSDGDFIITITRFNKSIENEYKTQKNKQVRIKRKTMNINSNQLIYRFNDFEDFCQFSNFISRIKNYSSLAKNVVLYLYQNNYYLCFTSINIEHENLKQLYTLITEFGTYVDNSDIFCKKLSECGKVAIKHNAIKTCVKFFNTSKNTL